MANRRKNTAEKIAEKKAQFFQAARPVKDYFGEARAMREIAAQRAKMCPNRRYLRLLTERRTDLQKEQLQCKENLNHLLYA